jgi:hypothetical protein
MATTLCRYRHNAGGTRQDSQDEKVAGVRLSGDGFGERRMRSWRVRRGCGWPRADRLSAEQGTPADVANGGRSCRPGRLQSPSPLPPFDGYLCMFIQLSPTRCLLHTRLNGHNIDDGSPNYGAARHLSTSSTEVLRYLDTGEKHACYMSSVPETSLFPCSRSDDGANSGLSNPPSQSLDCQL